MKSKESFSIKNNLFPLALRERGSGGEGFLNTFIFLLFILTPLLLSAQSKRGNNWYMGWGAGITFNGQDPPQAVYDGQMYLDLATYAGVASISDEDGNLLFYGSSRDIWNRDHEPMLNGNQLGGWSPQGAIIVPDPGDINLYYYFNFQNPELQEYLHFQYSVIDMRLDNGKGGVVPDKKCIRLLDYTYPHLSAVMHAAGTDVWVIVHDQGNNAYYSYRVTPLGIDPPVISYAGSVFVRENCAGYLKISPDGKKIAAVVIGAFASETFWELLDFDPSTGVVSDGNIVKLQEWAVAVEFSPNNELLYAKTLFMKQYDLKAGSPEEISSSGMIICNEEMLNGTLQVGPDGKIYFLGNSFEYLSVIHNPNLRGFACDAELDYLYVGDDRYLGYGLPSFIQSFFNDPEFTFTQQCFGQPTEFSIVNTDDMDYVEWKFNDLGNAPNDTSNLLSPSYTFSSAGTFVVQLKVHYSSIVRTVFDTVIIYAVPSPDFGPDTLFCPNNPISLTLDAGPGMLYNWNGNLTPGDSTLLVSDVGTYWVRVSNRGCLGRDTINVSLFPEPEIDTSTMVISNANCGLSDGSINGMQVTSAVYDSVEWSNGTGTIIGQSPEINNVPAGIYTLKVYFGNNCTIEQSFEIENNDAPHILGITVKQEDHCYKNLGELQVAAFSSTSDTLWYRVDGGSFSSANIISGLGAGTHILEVQDENGCISFESITIDNIPGPQVTDSVSTPETGYTANGTITITAGGDSIYYSIEGSSPQNTGYFEGLTSGTYKVTITDKWGCQRQVTMFVDRLIISVLDAVAKDDLKCKKDIAFSALTADNFINVKEFRTTLNYDDSRLQIKGYVESPDLDNVTVSYAANTIELEWNNPVPVTFNGTVTLTELVFETVNYGTADIKWDTVSSQFIDDHNNLIPCLLNPGIITINNPPEIGFSSQTNYCEGDKAEITINQAGGTGPFDYEWQSPVVVSGNTMIAVDSITTSYSGNYRVRVSDANQCADTLEFTINVFPLPDAGFVTVNDTIFYDKTFLLQARPGYNEYLWNTGDTTYFITVTEEGEYSVLMQTEEGCQAIENVYMLETFVPIQVPNAFTPNGDGLNDTFKPIVNTELVRQFSMSIYNKWGQLIFETNNSTKGWDGENALAGVYVWVISYANRVGKSEQFKGSVSLLK